MAVGAVVTVFWEATGRSEDLNAVIVSLPLALIALIVGSLLTPASKTRAGGRPEELAAA